MKLASTLTSIALALTVPVSSHAADPAKPNVVFILADDIGYGDVTCYNAQSKLETPRIDRLASEGMRFTDAHSASACTPTRYAILTGRYAFRSRVPVHVLMTYDPPLIEAGRLTWPALLKQQGYRTACIGKWHLGWDWPFKGGDKEAGPDFTQPIANGPTTRGFDEYFGTDVPNLPPYAFIENDRLPVQPTATFPGRDPELYVHQAGPMAPDWKFEQIMPALAARVDDYLRARAADKQPFFLYYTLTIPHEPLAPAAGFQGKSHVNRVGDLILQTDAATGAVLDTLEKLDLDQNTLVVFTSDNGHGPATGVPALLAAGHDPSRPFRGYKGSLLEGGHRVPFIVRWPGKVKAGALCDEVVSLNSLMATSAEILGARIPPGAGEDSCSILPLLLGQAENYRPARPVEIHAAVSGMAVRQGRWKLVESEVKRVNPARPDALRGLYDLQADPAETTNVAVQHPEIVVALKTQLDQFGSTKTAQSPPQKPNILLIVADDLGYGDVSANGCKDFQTPQLDALAAGGMRFAAGYVTAPLCSPSRAALLTGRHQCRVLTYGGNPPSPAVGLPLDVRTLADHLKGAGYRTAALGKWHLGESAELHPMSRGFDEFLGFQSGMHDYFKTDDERWGPIVRGRQREELKQYLTFALADEACAFVRRKTPEPFFLYLAFNAPHLPLQALDAYLARTAHLADPKRRVNAAMILALDDAVGRVMAALRESGREENTLVFFLSDNGAALIKGSAENGGSNAPLNGGKTQLWEGGIRIPFFAAWKGRVPAGRVIDDPVSALDVVPTALATARVNPQPEWKLDGVNLLPWLTGESTAPQRGPLFWKFGVNKTAIRDGAMKLVREGKEGGLFNVRQDIGETTDCTAAQPMLARQLEAAWKKWDADNLSTVRASGAQQAKESGGDGLRERFQSLHIGEVQPRGWLLDQIRTDSINGYFRLDVDWDLMEQKQYGSWAQVNDIAARCRARGIAFSMVFWAADQPRLVKTDTSPMLWSVGLMHQAEVYRGAGGRPDEIVIQSWLPTPAHSVPESRPETFTASALRLLEKYPPASWTGNTSKL